MKTDRQLAIGVIFDNPEPASGIGRHGNGLLDRRLRREERHLESRRENCFRHNLGSGHRPVRSMFRVEQRCGRQNLKRQERKTKRGERPEMEERFKSGYHLRPIKCASRRGSSPKWGESPLDAGPESI
jgi:hypothetical protein